MHGDRVLRACMLGLVLVNLVFVQLTEAAPIAWLAPLYALTVLAPLLAPLRRRLAYRALWNAGVIAVFCVLVRHASGYDLRYVLQDGLVLAVLCQVHLLNNLRAEQRPDLLFWNSFLIAVATGYLSQDLAYALAFLIYVPLYVIGLQILCVSRGQRELAPRATARILRDGLARSGVLLCCTLAVFLFWPRDFHRPSLLPLDFDLDRRGDALEIGFAKDLRLDRKGRAHASGRVVLTATLERGARADVPLLWRGITLGSTNGKEWWALNDADFASGVTGDVPWVRESDGSFTRGPATGSTHFRTGGPAPTLLSVEHVDPEANRLFTPLSAARLELGESARSERVVVHSDATLEYGAPRFARPAVLYTLALGGEAAPRPAGATPDRLAPGIARFTALPRSRHLRTARELADWLAARVPPGAPQHETVAAFRDYLETRYTYLPPGAEGSAATLAEFLAGEAGGHCEFFASALATMLRSRGVPCRVVTGFRSGEWDASGRVLTVRRRHAHAWVEVYDPAAGWYAVDPNPAAAPAGKPGLWDEVRSAARAAWSALTGFDAERRAVVLAWARELPERAWRGARANAGQVLLAVVLSVLALAARRWRRRRGTAFGVRVYRRALRRAGLALVPGETPRELLERARVEGASDRRLSVLAAATRDHERARYAA